MELIEQLKVCTKKVRWGLHTTKEREEYNRICYEICESVNWQTKQLSEIGEKVGMVGATILRNAKKHITETYEKDQAYANNYAVVKRKEIILKDCYNACEKNDWNIENLRMTSRVLRLKEEKIIENAKLYIIKHKYSPKEALEQEEYYKAQFEICNSYGWNLKEINKISKELNIILEEMINNAKIYILDYKKMTNEEFKQIIINSKKDYIRKYYQNNKKELFDKLLSISKENKEDIISLISLVTENNKVRLTGLRESGISYAYTYHQKNVNKIVIELEARINIYKKYINSTKTPKPTSKKQNSIVISSEQCIEDFIVSNFKTMESFCKEKNIDIKEINQTLHSFKKARNKNKLDLYKRYLTSLLTKNSKEIELLATAHKMVELIKNGIEEIDGTKRKFDIIDYYSLMMLDFEDFMILVEPYLNTEEIKCLKIYCDRNYIMNPKDLDINKLKTGKIKLGYSIQKEDSKEIYYPTLAEIELIEEYLKKHNVPFNMTSYKDAMKRLLINISLTKESNQILIKTK